MFKKCPFMVESFIIVGSFDCDCTQLEVGGKPKVQGKHWKNPLGANQLQAPRNLARVN